MSVTEVVFGMAPASRRVSVLVPMIVAPVYVLGLASVRPLLPYLVRLRLPVIAPPNVLPALDTVVSVTGAPPAELVMTPPVLAFGFELRMRSTAWLLPFRSSV